MTTVPRPRQGIAATLDALPAALGGLWRGKATEAAWVRPAQLGLALLAGALYLVNLTVSGYANVYYSAAALAASQSWSAWFFGSIDAANFITVDKPPLATMLMGLSVRLFGLSSWSILLPEALCGVATVLVLFAVVRRSFGPAAALVAGLAMALTPAAVLMFRYNNPDALLTLLLVLAAWAFVRSLEDGRLRWVILAGLFVGLAFNTKYLQAYLVLPAFAVTYLVAAAGSLRRRLGGLAVAAAAVLLSSAWWVVPVELLPASARPYIGGSTNDSVLDLIFGYDGLGRIFGFFGVGGPGGGGGGGGFGGSPGLLRLFNAEFGGQVSWLLPAALLAIPAGMLMHLHKPRTDPARAGYLMWGLWFAVTALVFSFMSGIIHSYYVVALAPAVAALVGAVVVDLWKLRERTPLAGLALAALILISGIWAWQLLERTPDFLPGLGLAILALSAVAAALVMVPTLPSLRRLSAIALLVGVAAMLLGPAAYALDTMATAYSGGDPSAGPAAADRGGFAGGGPGSIGQDGGFTGGAQPPSGTGIGPGSGGTGAPSAPDGTSDGGTGGSVGAPGGTAGGPGSVDADSALVAYLLANRGTATWIVAATSAQQAGSIELASGAPVMAMGGFTGSDPTPTLAELQAYVASGQLRYVLVGGAGFGPGGAGGGGSSEITQWVQSAGTVVDYGGSGSLTLYDLSGAASGS
ncbi:MAG TPA: glycosyltransferase family 39 protein [Candidatus Dormibacteraeota bacterium]|nr:glycosyltransferase family 39 protein [Candidatus Dormibacteraeota bacterium]